MKKWKKNKLSELCTKIGSGATPRGGDSSYKSHGISLIRSQNILDFTFSTDGLAFIDLVQAKGLANVEIKERDVFINITGDSVARVCQVPNNILPARVNQHVSILRTNRDLLNPEFLKYSLLSRENKEMLLSLASTGATRKALTKNMLEQFEINVPDEEGTNTQYRIASILSYLDDKIELNRRMNQTLEQMAQALFNHYFVDNIDPDNLPHGWGLKMLDEVADFQNGFAFYTIGYSSSGYKVVDLANIHEGGRFIETKSDKYIPEGIYKTEKFKKYHLKINDIVMAMTDMTQNMGILGKCGIIRENKKFILNQRIGRIRVHNDIDVDFLSIYLNSSSIIGDLKMKSLGSVQKYINTNHIKELRFVIPQQEIMKEFSNLVSPIIGKIYSNDDEVKMLTKTRDTLLPKLMSGEIDVDALMKEESLIWNQKK